MVVDLDLRVKPRDPEASIRVALRWGTVSALQRARTAAHHWVGAVAVGVTAVGRGRRLAVSSDGDGHAGEVAFGSACPTNAS